MPEIHHHDFFSPDSNKSLRSLSEGVQNLRSIRTDTILMFAKTAEIPLQKGWNSVKLQDASACWL